MQPDSEVIRRLTAAAKTHSLIVVQANCEPHKQTTEQRQEFKYQLHVLEQEIEPLQWWLGHELPRESVEAERIKAFRTTLLTAQGAYSSILNEAERNEQNQTIAESERFRYLLHGLSAKIEVIQWVLDLNAHSQPSGEHLVREANNIINPPTPPAACA